MKRLPNALALLAAALLVAACARGVETQAQTAAPAPQKKTANLNVAIFVFEGVQIIDYTAPYEVLGQAHVGGEHLFNVYTVAEKEGPVTTAMGMTVVPRYTFANMPKPDVLLLPGGGVTPHLENAKVIKWVQETAAGADHVLSVCNGAFYLGKAGLLDGLTATTFYGLIDELKKLAPKANVVTDRRFADNGKIVTTAGLSSGIDGALHLIEKLAGRGKAQEVALNLEYNWQPDVPYARASFADHHLRRLLGREGFTLPEGTGWKVLGQQGAQDRWEKSWEVRTPLPAAELLKIIDAKLAERWTKLPTPAASSAPDTRWKFSDAEGRAWNARSLVEPAGESGVYKLTIRLARSEVAAQAQVN
jgi:putative intracellular protease/amidase